MARSKAKRTTTTSVSAKVPVEEFKPDPTKSELDNAVDLALHERAECNVQLTTYRGRHPQKNWERAIHIMHDGRNIVTLATAYNGKSPDLKITPYTADDLKKATMAAAFRMNKCGIPRGKVDSRHASVTSAWDLWMAVFNGDFDNHLAAKAQYLALIGAQDPAANFKRVQKRAEAIEAEQAAKTTEQRYVGVEGFGQF